MSLRRRLYLLPALLLACAILAACSSGPRKSSGGRVVTTQGGGYYKDDGPGSSPPKDIHRIPNAVPRIEPLAKANTRPYTVLGKSFTPLTDHRSFRQTGTASWYGRKFHGQKTANGETYDMYAMTAAHPTLPIPSYAKVSRPGSSQSVIVRINDRGPFHSSRIIDLSYVAAAKLGLIGPGSGTVVVQAITPDEIRAGNYGNNTAPVAPPPKPAGNGLHLEPDRDQHGLEALIAASAVNDTAQTDDSFIEETDNTPSWSRNQEDQQLAIRPSDRPSPNNGTGIYLQFGAFSAPQNASSLASRLNQQIRSIEVRSAEVEAVNTLYRVQIGPYPTRTEAVNAALRIQQHTGEKPSLAVR